MSYIGQTKPLAVVDALPDDSVGEQALDVNALQVAGLLPTAWCVFDGTLAGTNAPIAGYNVTSVTKTATGRYTINFDTAMLSTNFAITTLAATTAASTFMVESAIPARITTSVSVIVLDESAIALDASIVNAHIFGGKA